MKCDIMNGETALKIIKTLKIARAVVPVVMVAGLILLAAGGFIRPLGDEIDHDAFVL